MLHTTPRVELRRQRIAVAKRMLLDSAMKISGVAAACHYSGMAAFVRNFRQITGLNPIEFRRRFQRIVPNRRRT